MSAIAAPPPPGSPGTIDIRCETCGATVVVEPRLRTARCPYCDSPAVVERPPSPERPEPTFVLGFTVDADRAQAAVRHWIARSSRFARSGFKEAVLENTRGIYVPAWLYNAVGHSRWRCVIGENYTVTETYTTTDSKGRAVTRTRTVTKTEHRRLAGDLAAYVVDVLVTASSGLSNDELESVEPFDLRSLRRWDPAIVSGWIAEEASVAPEASRELCHGEAWRRIGRRLNALMPGDSHHGLEHDTTLSDEELNLVLLPVWVFVARYDAEREPVRILVNGQTGIVAGKVPRSGLKIFLTVLLALAAMALFVLAAAAVMGALQAR